MFEKLKSFNDNYFKNAMLDRYLYNKKKIVINLGFIYNFSSYEIVTQIHNVKREL